MHNQATIHPLVLAAVTILTICSVVAMASVSGPALLNTQNHSTSQYTETAQTIEQLAVRSNSAPAGGANNEFESVVQPALSSCFNCGEVIAIETIGSISADDLQLELLLHEAYNGHAASLIGSKVEKAYTTDKDTLHGKPYTPQDNLFVPPSGEQPHTSNVTYLIKVRMQNGTQHTITQDTPPEQAVGDKIRISSGTLTAT